jgi:hypothetical protein
MHSYMCAYYDSMSITNLVVNAYAQQYASQFQSLADEILVATGHQSSLVVRPAVNHV